MQLQKHLKQAENERRFLEKLYSFLMKIMHK